MEKDRPVVPAVGNTPSAAVRRWTVLSISTALMLAATGCGTTPVAKGIPPRPTTAEAHTPVAVGTIRRIAFANSSNGWMAFTPPGAPTTVEIAYTGDGGAVWAQTKRLQVGRPGGWTWAPLGRHTLLVVVSSPSNTGSLNSVLTTTDSGQTWRATQFHSAVGPGYLVTAKTGSRAACALVASEPSLGGVAATLYCGPVDGRWHQVATRFGSGPAGFLPGLFPNGLTMAGGAAWITGQNVSSGPDLLYASHASGRSFQPLSVPVPAATNADTWPMVVTPGAAPALPVILYGSTGATFLVYHQTAHGAWQAATPLTTQANPGPPGALLYSAVSTQVMFVRGRHTLYATANGGTTWTAVNHVPNAWSLMQFATANQGWAVAAPATLLHTADGGRTWTTERYRVYRPH